MSKRPRIDWRLAAVLFGVGSGVAAPVFVTAPAPVQASDAGAATPTLEDVVAATRASQLQGWELVDYATKLVNARFIAYSCWHLWESSGAAFAHRRGFSVQYNFALARVLRTLGFTVQGVHAARVRFDDEPGVELPWWRTGHTWLNVHYQGRTRDVCAGHPGRGAGEVGFTPESDVRPVHTRTPINIRLLLMPGVVGVVWRSWLHGRPVPEWLYRPFPRPNTME